MMRGHWQKYDSLLFYSRLLVEMTTFLQCFPLCQARASHGKDFFWEWETCMAKWRSRNVENMHYCPPTIKNDDMITLENCRNQWQSSKLCLGVGGLIDHPELFISLQQKLKAGWWDRWASQLNEIDPQTWKEKPVATKSNQVPFIPSQRNGLLTIFITTITGTTPLHDP